ncbi:MAG: DUF4012 domain-containing protein [Egibacteraceae bacterium]
MQVEEQAGARTRHSVRRPQRRWLLVLAGVIILGVLAWAAVVASATITTRAALLAARGHLERGQRQGLAFELDDAAASLEQAHAELSLAERQLTRRSVRAGTVLPVVGANLDTALGITQATRRTVDAGLGLLDASEGLLDGAREGAGLPTGEVKVVAERLERASEQVASARRMVAGAPPPGLLPVVVDARAELATELADLGGMLDTARDVTRVGASLLGADEPRRYFFAAQNPAELRGTGGFIGAWTIVTVRDGGLSFGNFRPIQQLVQAPPGTVRSPSRAFTRRYGRYGALFEWKNANMTPHFPWAATVLERLYKEVRGDRIDGVIAADPHGLAILGADEGGVIGRNGRRLRGEALVDYLANEAFSEIEDQALRKRVLGQLATGVAQRFLGGLGDGPRAAMAALSEAVEGGHVQLHLRDEAGQEALERLGAAGSFGAVGDDFLSVIVNNGAANKVDYYVQQDLRHRVELQPDGSAESLTVVEIQNDAPRAGAPKRVLGPSAPGLEVGDNRSLLTLYCARTCEPGLVPPFTEIDRERDQRALGVQRIIRRKEPFELRFPTTTAQAWTASERRGRYRLTLRGQPVLRPTSLELQVRIPAGFRVTQAPTGAQVDGRTVRWEGTMPFRRTMSISFVKH